MAFKCPKCGKSYKTQGAPYKKHIESCTGKKQPPKREKRSSSTKKVEISSSLIKRLDDIEYRLSKLEEKINNISIGNNEKLKIQKSAMVLPVSNEVELNKIIKNIINETSNIYSIKGVIPLEDLKDILYRNYNLSQRKFEELILKLYRKELIDLQAGGTPTDYHLESPTGKKFYYLMVKQV